MSMSVNGRYERGDDGVSSCNSELYDGNVYLCRANWRQAVNWLICDAGDTRLDSSHKSTTTRMSKK